MATEKSFTDKLIGQLKKSASDIEKFRVQLSLGKAEAKDKYEDLKKKFNGAVHKVKTELTGSKSKLTDFRSGLEELQVQLALGKAERLEIFNEQKKKIFRAINSLDKQLENYSGKIDAAFRHEVEKFRIKMEILRVHYELGKMEAKDEFELEKHELKNVISKMSAKFQAKKKNAVNESKERISELKEAYKHLKKAIVD